MFTCSENLKCVLLGLLEILPHIAYHFMLGA